LKKREKEEIKKMGLHCRGFYIKNKELIKRLSNETQPLLGILYIEMMDIENAILYFKDQFYKFKKAHAHVAVIEDSSYYVHIAENMTYQKPTTMEEIMDEPCLASREEHSLDAELELLLISSIEDEKTIYGKFYVESG
jgi:hypothetical protein